MNDSNLLGKVKMIEMGLFMKLRRFEMNDRNLLEITRLSENGLVFDSGGSRMTAIFWNKRLRENGFVFKIGKVRDEKRNILEQKLKGKWICVLRRQTIAFEDKIGKMHLKVKEASSKY